LLLLHVFLNFSIDLGLLILPVGLVLDVLEGSHAQFLQDKVKRDQMTQEEDCAQVKEEGDTQNQGIAQFHILAIKVKCFLQDFLMVHVSCNQNSYIKGNV